MICDDFFYAGHWLSDFSLQVSDPNNDQAFVTREIDKADMSARRSVPNHYSTHYSSTLILYFSIMKDSCQNETQEEFKMTGSEINQIRAWLESAKRPMELRIKPEQEEEPTYYYGIFTDIQPFLYDQECYGLYLTFTCNAPYGFSVPTTKICSVNSTTGTFSLIYNNLSCELNEYLYPTIIVEANGSFTGSEQIKIVNHSDDDKAMYLTMPSGSQNLYINCQKKTIVDEDGTLIPLSKVGMETSEINDEYSIVSAGMYNVYWLGLVAGKNDLEISTLTSNKISQIVITAKVPRKTGGF